MATKRALLVQFYKNFLYLFIGTYCLEHPRLLRSHCDHANERLRLFVSDFGKLYGKITLVYNIHNLIYLAADAQKFGHYKVFLLLLSKVTWETLKDYYVLRTALCHKLSEECLKCRRVVMCVQMKKV